MDVNIVKSGSSGNMIVIDDVLCIDAGVSRKMFEENSANVEHLFITHRHGDHLNPSVIKWIAKNKPSLLKNGLHVNRDSYEKIMSIDSSIGLLIQHDLEPYSNFEVKSSRGYYSIETYPLEHDVENQGFIITSPEGETLIHATDTSTMKHAPNRKYDILLIEGNYDEEIVMDELTSDDLNAQARAVRNLRHLSTQACHDFILRHSHSKSKAYQLHASEIFGIKLDL